MCRMPSCTAVRPRIRLRSSGAHGVAALLIDIPEGGGVAPVGKALPQAELVDALFHALAALPRCADARHIALYIAQKHRYARVGKGLRHHLHGDGLAGAAGAGDEPVAVAHIQRQLHTLVACQTHIDLTVLVHRVTLRRLLMLIFAIIRPLPSRRKKKAHRPRFSRRMVRWSLVLFTKTLYTVGTRREAEGA